MEQINSFFTIEYSDNKNGICHVYPPKEGGAFIEYKDIASFLENRGFLKFDKAILNNALRAGIEVDVNIGPGDGFEFAETVIVDISMDKMEAIVKLYPGTKNGAKLQIKDYIAELQKAGVRTGINQELMLEMVTNPVYLTEIVIAKGCEAVHGTDAYIEYKFNTDPSLKPAVNEDGTVDFKNLNVISHVKKGDVLAILHKETHGKPGRDVFGKEIQPRTVKTAAFSRGKNYIISEDGTVVTSEVTGHASLVMGEIFVSDVYEVPADVDNTTGNINYDGNIRIHGTVREGFEVIAKGDIIIDGSVEGALVSSGGQIVVEGGINGMNKGVVDADGAVITKYIENGRVFSKEYVATGSVINSEVVANTEVVVTNKKGFIAGGSVRAGMLVEAQTIGSTMGAATKIEVGVDPQKKARFMEVQRILQEKSAELQKITPIINNYNSLIQAGQPLDEKNKQYYVTLLNMMKNDSEEVNRLQGEYQIMAKDFSKESTAKVKALKDIFPGVCVIMGEISMTIRDKRSHCVLERKGADIVINNL